ncbi:hypothetical protein B0H14DRAFT_3904531 [Mycena olivaceomarginata]|nr:hypothetical protein B0H14DRAFT_3904531 [Mycena olivaceomarginata]
MGLYDEGPGTLLVGTLEDLKFLNGGIGAKRVIADIAQGAPNRLLQPLKSQLARGDSLGVPDLLQLPHMLCFIVVPHRPANKELRTIIQRELSIHTICDFPSELLARTMKLLAYFDILRAGMVCKLWNTVVREDPEIAELLHKRTCRSIAGPFELCGETESSEPVVVHPALQLMSYCMGQEIETAAIFRPATETVTHPDSLQKFPIIDLGIAHDFATRPTVHFARELPTRGASLFSMFCRPLSRECFVIDSPVLTLPRTSDGLVTDDMVDQAFQAAFTPEGVRRGKWLNKAHCLEGFRRYEGLEAVRKGLRVNAAVVLGSQPSEDESTATNRLLGAACYHSIIVGPPGSLTPSPSLTKTTITSTVVSASPPRTTTFTTTS